MITVVKHKDDTNKNMGIYASRALYFAASGFWLKAQLDRQNFKEEKYRADGQNFV